ncbi:LysR family transcriptional regulator [Pseudonocardia spinosispora]|uniref:LysR family transcriptional regulator n=1 Tax=Pseudonocardia spinosispora TaxID=103441 RepID=UPI000403905A|nr:LysR substrate-binding domain-containing protein [Pseudonocardia spinosispora]
MDFSVVGLRVLREVVDRGTLTSAAESLGYTQSAVSRQIAALEKTARATLLERRRDGVRLTAAGHVVLRHASAALDELDAVAGELAGLPSATGTVRLGTYPSAGAVLLPRALTALRRAYPGVTVTTREASTSALVRALRAGSIDLAVLSSGPPFRAPDTESPALRLETLAERNLCLAVPAGHPLAQRDWVDVTQLAGQRWIAGRSSADEQLMGVWPGLDGRPEVAHVARDWLAKLNLVAAGCGVTTVPVSLLPVMPSGVRVLTVRGGPEERRRVVLATLPRPLSEPATRLAEALRAAAE